MRATLIGSFVERDLPTDFGAMFAADVLIDPRNGTPMEMDGYSAYLAIKAIELRTGADLLDHRKNLTAAVVDRLHAEPPFEHGAWTTARGETHMRFTAAALRLLTEACIDGIATKAEVLTALRFHLGFHDRLEAGIWFLHDSLETDVADIDFPATVFPNRAWGSGERNNLVLNTHVDTLSSAVAAIDLLDTEDTADLEALVRSGLDTLRYVLTLSTPGWGNARYDSTFRSAFFAAHRIQFKGAYQARMAIAGAYLNRRAAKRSRDPIFVFPDGYIERDITLMGTGYEYHLVNVCDLYRLATALTGSTTFHNEPDFIALLRSIAGRGLSYAMTSSYMHVLRWRLRYSKGPIQLCEAIAMQLACGPDEALPDNWLERYCELRRSVAPTAALLGYDPFVVGHADRVPFTDGQDRLNLLDGRSVVIDFNKGTASYV